MPDGARKQGGLATQDVGLCYQKVKPEGERHRGLWRISQIAVFALKVLLTAAP